MSVLHKLAARLSPRTLKTYCRYLSSRRYSSIANGHHSLYPSSVAANSLYPSSVAARRFLSASQRFCTDFHDEIELRAPQNDERIQLAKYEYELYKDQNPGSVPEEISEEAWEKLSQFTSEEKRFKYFHFLKVKEDHKENNREKKLAKRAHIEEYHQEIQKEMETNPHISYGLWRNSITIKRCNQWMDRHCHLKMVRSRLLGQSIIFDFDYEQHMSAVDMSHLAKQFMHAYTLNRYFDDPFYLKIFNYNSGGKVAKRVKELIPNIEADNTLVDIHSEDFLCSHREEEMVLITSHSRTDMEEVDPDVTYVIPAYVGRGGNKPVAIAKAKRDGVRHVRIPYDKYLHLGRSCRKDLPLNIVLSILLEVKQHGSWETAFRNHFPRRMLDTSVNGGFKLKPSYSPYERRKVMHRRYLTPFREDAGDEPSSDRQQQYEPRGGSPTRYKEYDSNRRSPSDQEYHSSPSGARSYNQEYDYSPSDSRSYNQRGGSRNQEYDYSPSDSRSYNQRGGSRDQEYDYSPSDRSYNQDYNSNHRGGSSNHKSRLPNPKSQNFNDVPSKKKPEKIDLNSLLKSLF